MPRILSAIAGLLLIGIQQASPLHAEGLARLAFRVINEFGEPMPFHVKRLVNTLTDRDLTESVAASGLEAKGVPFGPYEYWMQSNYSDDIRLQYHGYVSVMSSSVVHTVPIPRGYLSAACINGCVDGAFGRKEILGRVQPKEHLPPPVNSKVCIVRMQNLFGSEWYQDAEVSPDGAFHMSLPRTGKVVFILTCGPEVLGITSVTVTDTSPGSIVITLPGAK